MGLKGIDSMFGRPSSITIKSDHSGIESFYHLRFGERTTLMIKSDHSGIESIFTSSQRMKHSLIKSDHSGIERRDVWLDFAELDSVIKSDHSGIERIVTQ